MYNEKSHSHGLKAISFVTPMKDEAVATVTVVPALIEDNKATSMGGFVQCVF